MLCSHKVEYAANYGGINAHQHNTLSYSPTIISVLAHSLGCYIVRLLNLNTYLRK